MSDYDEIKNALSYVDSRDRDTWIQVGAGLKDELGEDGFNLWDEWSQGADNYNARDAKTAWKSLKPGYFHINSMFFYARQNGYRPDKPYTPPTPEQRAARAAELEARRQETERLKAETQAKVQKTAQGIWNRSAPVRADHPYLVAKGITAASAVAGLRQNSYQGDDNLVVPVYDGGELVNIQSVNQDGQKRFLSGGKVEGCYAVVGDTGNLSDGLVIAEGYATAASIHQATGRPVIVAFTAGNMVTVSERLAKNLPADVPVMLAVDNDASQTGIHKAQEAARYFGGRAVAVQPEFTMTQIQQFQKGKGVDEKGRPPLPSDFNDLHQLAGIEAVRDRIETAFRRPEPVIAAPEPQIPAEAAPESPTAAPLSQSPAAEPDDWEAVLQAERAQSGWKSPPPAPATVDPATEPVSDPAPVPEPASEPSAEAAITETAASAAPQQETDMTPLPEEARPSENPAPEAENGIEYAAPERRHAQEPAASVHDWYELHDPQTGMTASRATQAEIQADAERTGIGSYTGVTADGRRERFVQTADGWEPYREPAAEPQPAGPEQSGQSHTAAEAAPERADTFSDGPDGQKKPVLDLGYNIPPDSIKSRYVTTENMLGQSQYRRIDNHNTVVFSDWGGSLHTPRTDRQVVEDMLEVAKAKGWDGIKINGSKDFRRMMFLEAESQGIHTSGYKPTPQDLALLETMRQRRAVNGIEAAPQEPEVHRPSEKVPPVQTAAEKSAPAPYAEKPTAPPKDIGERIVSFGSAPYRHNPENQDSPYIVLEKNGRERTVWGVDIPDAVERSGAEVGDRIRLHSLGKQPVEITVDGEVKDAHRNMFRIEILQSRRGQEKQPGQPQSEQPDAAMLSAAERLRAQGAVPTAAAINTSPEADTNPAVPLQGIGGKEIPAEVNAAADRMKAEAVDIRYMSAKTVYAEKAGKLSKKAKAHLLFYEQNIKDTIRNLKGDARTLALTNYYEYTAKQMSGSKLKLPLPAQIPSQVQSPQQQMQTRTAERTRAQEPEISR